MSTAGRRGHKHGTILGLGALLWAAPLVVMAVPGTLPAVTTQWADSAATASTPSLWDQLRQGFALPDASHDPEIHQLARTFTRNPAQFEAQLREGLSRLAYIQPQVAARGIPAEFALLPWVESHYKPVLRNRSRPVGMWQIMPITAHHIGLKLNSSYEGRLDIKASTNGVLALLQRYHAEFGDWRLVDYAFNSGQSAVQRGLATYGSPPQQPLLPRFPVPVRTRQHLGKLLAIASIIRHPQRYRVVLPKLPNNEKLEPVALHQRMPLKQAAQQAGMTTQQFKQLNGAFLGSSVDPRQTHTLLLPKFNAQQWRAQAPFAYQKTANRTIPEPPLLSSTDLSSSYTAKPEAAPKRKRYRVAHGDTLWSVARRHHISLTKLKHWNRLSKATVRPGQILLVSPPQN